MRPLEPPAGPTTDTQIPSSRGRRVAYWVVLAVTTVVTTLSVLSVWANRQLLNTGAWTDTSTRLLQNQAIRDETASFLADQLYANVDVEGQLRGFLPKDLKPLAAPAAAAARNVVDDAAAQALENPKVQAGWAAVNRKAHESLVKLIEDRGAYTSIQGNRVVLNLRPILVSTASRVGLGQAVQAGLPPDAATVEILRADELPMVQEGARALRTFDWVLRLLVLLGLGLAMWLARGRRAEALVACGAVLVIAGLAALLVRSAAGGIVVDQLATSEAVRPAATAAWSIGTQLLATMAWSTIFVGLPAVAVGLLLGPWRWARGVRARLAPMAREHVGYLFGTAMAIVLLLVLIEPVPATRKPVPVLLILLVMVGGAQALRRLIVAEHPSA